MIFPENYKCSPHTKCHINPKYSCEVFVDILIKLVCQMALGGRDHFANDMQRALLFSLWWLAYMLKNICGLPYMYKRQFKNCPWKNCVILLWKSLGISLRFLMSPALYLLKKAFSLWNNFLNILPRRFILHIRYKKKSYSTKK